MKTMNRREALRAIGVGAAVGSALTATTAVAVAAHVNAHPDAELLRLGVEMEELWVVENATYAAAGDDVSDETDAVCQAANRRTSAVVDRIGACRASTLEGFIVKARAVSWCCVGEPLHEDADTTDLRIASSIINELLAMRGAA